MSYDINSELLAITRQKMPANVKLLPVMNTVMKIFKCKSDDKVSVEKYLTPGHEGAQLTTYVIEPKNCKANLPCIVFFHGGGFMLKASGAHYQIAKMYAEKAYCKVIYTDYRLAPKYSYPIPVEDCYCTYKWTIEHSDKLGIDRNRVMIGGDSAGGNLAAAVTLMLHQRDHITPKGALLIYPVTDRRMITESMKKYTDTPVWDAVLSKMMWTAYLGKKVPSEIQYASPMEAATLAMFPKTYIEVAEFDSLRDEGIAFANKLQEDGVSVEFHEVKGACHGFETALKSTIVRDAMQRRVAWMENIFE